MDARFRDKTCASRGPLRPVLTTVTANEPQASAHALGPVLRSPDSPDAGTQEKGRTRRVRGVESTYITIARRSFLPRGRAHAAATTQQPRRAAARTQNARAREIPPRAARATAPQASKPRPTPTTMFRRGSSRAVSPNAALRNASVAPTAAPAPPAAAAAVAPAAARSAVTGVSAAAAPLGAACGKPKYCHFEMSVTRSDALPTPRATSLEV